MRKAFAAAAIAVCLAASGPARAGDGVQISLKLDKTRFFVGEPMFAWVAIENRSDVYVRANLAEVLAVQDSRGAPLPRVSSMANPRARRDETVLIAPRSERVERFEPLVEYGIETAGDYSLEASVGLARSERVRISVTRLDAVPERFLACLTDDFNACVTRTPGKLPAFQTDPLLAPYVAIAKLRSSRRSGEPKDLVAWKRDFERRFPSFDQPVYLLDQITSHLYDRKDAEQLAKLLAEGAARLGDHPVLRWVRVQSERFREEQAKAAESEGRPAER